VAESGEEAEAEAEEEEEEEEGHDVASDISQTLPWSWPAT